MTRIICRASACVYWEHGECGAEEIEYEPDDGCLTFEDMGDLELEDVDDEEEEDDDLDWDGSAGTVAYADEEDEDEDVDWESGWKALSP